ncbi:6-phosphogluconate dehydrogenase NADP-binding protein [Teratosphaeria destructans]|uniref:6-phosphogluconate dehydrogenase NADP-binding protein n=1 Tax=Teratosphaeria destructans TaxID=418781 RepID=A0A9W7SMQ9_9PEZI|nr:6-phosphogluconate dehydrogenase NADP-binding protein [Teratosphaeria destructans]
MAWRRRSFLLAICPLLFLIVLGFILFDHSLNLKSSLAPLHKPIWSLIGVDLGSEPPPDESPYGALVVAGQGHTTDLSWVRRVRFWKLYNYDVDARPDRHNRFKIPENKGHEAMVYLSFIIDHYEILPWASIFIHGHAESWHQEFDMAGLISGMRLEALQEEGYISLRCDWYPSCPAEMKPVHRDSAVSGPGALHKESEAAIAGNWRFILPGETLPKIIASQCCAQFAVTRRAIQRRPKSDYERMRQWLLDSLLEDEVSGRVFEKLWAYIFTGDAVQ